MKTYFQGISVGILLSISIILFIGAKNHRIEVGRFQYYISTDDITKKHYSRIFDSSTGIVYHKTYMPGGDQADVKWVDGERIERRYFRPDMSIWNTETWEDYKKAYEENRSNN
tara:strand:- start:445 stop:783 length:339 start_codon:yes stop_codon:yes gene_type:complete